jgi:hypothetical protein
MPVILREAENLLLSLLSLVVGLTAQGTLSIQPESISLPANTIPQ